MIPLLLAAKPGFYTPGLEELFEYPALLFKQPPLSQFVGLNRVGILLLLQCVILCVFVWRAIRKPKVVPGKLQTLFEAFVQFIRDYVVIEVIGPAGLRWVPFLTTLFLFILLGNVFEVLPAIIFPTNGRMAMPMMFAIMAWSIFIIVGMKEQGILKYFKNSIAPSGVPKLILPLVVPIELVSTFIVRPITLAIRLFANMMAGHILLSIVFIATSAFTFDVIKLQPSIKGLPIGIVAFAAGPAAIAFELLIDILQAYIFTILTAVYIADSMHPEH